jgi:hypothetical protein
MTGAVPTTQGVPLTITNETPAGTAMPSDAMTATPGSQSSSGAVSGATAGTPAEAINGFYQWYITQSGNPLSSGTFQSSQFLSLELAQKIAAQVMGSGSAASGDPFVCAQNMPTSFTVDDPKVNGDTATATVHTQYSGGSAPTNLTVTLKQSGGQWQITDVACAANQ